jgi:hypothetical protein
MAEIRVEYLPTYARNITVQANLLILVQNDIISDKHILLCCIKVDLHSK